MSDTEIKHKFMGEIIRFAKKAVNNAEKAYKTDNIEVSLFVPNHEIFEKDNEDTNAFIKVCKFSTDGKTNIGVVVEGNVGEQKPSGGFLVLENGSVFKINKEVFKTDQDHVKYQIETHALPNKSDKVHPLVEGLNRRFFELASDNNRFDGAGGTTRIGGEGGKPFSMEVINIDKHSSLEILEELTDIISNS